MFWLFSSAVFILLLIINHNDRFFWKTFPPLRSCTFALLTYETRYLKDLTKPEVKDLIGEPDFKTDGLWKYKLGLTIFLRPAGTFQVFFDEESGKVTVCRIDDSEFD